MTKDWIDIHHDFTSRLKELWEEHLFTTDQVQQWINKGLRPTDYDLARYIKKKGYNCEQKSDLVKLRKEYNNNPDWENIHWDFVYYRENWLEVGSTYAEAKQWIEIGLNCEDYLLSALLKKDGYSLTNINNIDKVFWRNIHPEFSYWHRKEWERVGMDHIEAKKWIELSFDPSTSYQIQQWKRIRFSYEEIKSWIEKGLIPQDYDFAYCLQKDGYQPTDLKENNRKELEKKVSWQDIHKDFDFKKRKEWEKQGFKSEECKEWIEIGFAPNELNHVKQWKKIGSAPSQVKQWAEMGFRLGDGWNHIKKWRELDLTDEEIKQLIKNGFYIYNQESFKNWKKRGFTTPQIRKWISSGLGTSEFDYALWLKDIKKVDPEWILNNDIKNKDLKEQYEKLCSKCQQSSEKTIGDLCRSCNSKCFQEDFNKWTSGNLEIDRFIQKCQFEASDLKRLLEWIPYEQFTDIEYLAEGGFSKVYKANWVDGIIQTRNIKKNKWIRNENCSVVLKVLNNSQDLKTDFLQEITYHRLFNCYWIIACHGISQDPFTKNYTIVMQYVPNGSLRNYLQNSRNNRNFNEINLYNKVFWLRDISAGLDQIHEQNLIHRDLHLGNILHYHSCYCGITDLGMSRPVNAKNEEEIYGVLPYVAPEVLNKKGYIPASDIYSFGMVAYEILSGLPHHYDREYDVHLVLEICDGIRPNLDITETPQLLKDLIKQCWDANPEKRPKANELFITLDRWRDEILGEIIEKKKDTEFYLQYKEKKYSHNSLSLIPNRTKFISRLLPTEKIESLDSLEMRWKSIVSQHKDDHSNNLTLNIDPLNEETKCRSRELDFDIEITENNNNTKRQLSLETQVKTNQEKTKLTKITENKYQPEPMEIDYSNWQTLCPNFTSKLINSWINQNFTYSQTQEWINIGLTPQDAEFANFLKIQKNLTPEKVLNEYNFEELKQEFINSQQNSQIIQTNLPNFQNK